MNQRSIVLVPFSDQSGRKVRPALIVSNNTFNGNSDDLVVCAITSMLKKGDYTLIIGQDNLEVGTLYEKSPIKVETILKIKKSFIIKEIAKVNNKTFFQVFTLL